MELVMKYFIGMHHFMEKYGGDYLNFVSDVLKLLRFFIQIRVPKIFP